MSRIFLFSIIVLTGLMFLLACNNDSASGNKDSENAGKGFVWTTEDDNEFLADCIEEAKANFNYGEDTAYIKCNCALKQLKTKYQNYDSVEVALNDTAKAKEAVKLTESCY